MRARRDEDRAHRRCPAWRPNTEAVSVMDRNPLLVLTAALLAATLQLALPNLHVEVPGAEDEALPGETIASPRPTKNETAGGNIS
jgi:hypothetical protein